MLGCQFRTGLVDELRQLVHGLKRRTLATLDGGKAILGSETKPFQPGLVFGLPLFEQPQALAHDLTGVAEAARADSGLNEAIEVLGEVYVACRHGRLCVRG